MSPVLGVAAGACDEAAEDTAAWDNSAVLLVTCDDSTAPLVA